MEAWLLNDPIGFMVLGLIRNIVYALVAFGLLAGLFEGLFWWMNRAIGVKFKSHVWDKIKDDPPALAQYFGYRIHAVIIGCAIFAAYFLK